MRLINILKNVSLRLILIVLTSLALFDYLVPNAKADITLPKKQSSSNFFDGTNKIIVKTTQNILVNGKDEFASKLSNDNISDIVLRILKDNISERGDFKNYKLLTKNGSEEVIESEIYYLIDVRKKRAYINKKKVLIVSISSKLMRSKPADLINDFRVSGYNEVYTKVSKPHLVIIEDENNYEEKMEKILNEVITIFTSYLNNNYL